VLFRDKTRVLKMSTAEAEGLANQLMRAVEEARDHGLNQVHNDLNRGVEYVIIPSIEEREVQNDKYHHKKFELISLC